MKNVLGSVGKVFLFRAGLPIGLVVLAVLLIAGGVIFGIKTNPEILGLSKGNAQVQAEVDTLIAEVGKLIELPADERPTVATVTDVEKLKAQPFFQKAQNGDRILVFTNARRAILYRPTEKRIVDVGAVNIQQQPSGQPAGSPDPNATPGAEATPAPTEESTPAPTPEATPSQ